MKIIHTPHTHLSMSKLLIILLALSPLIMSIIIAYFLVIKPGNLLNKIKNVKLKNGVNCVLIRNPFFGTTVIKVQIKAGYAYNDTKLEGMHELLKNVILQGSTKYWTSGLLDTHAKNNHGRFEGKVRAEVIEFELQISDLEIKKCADMFAWSIASPRFDENLVNQQIEDYDIFYQYLKTDKDFIRKEVLKMLYDPDYTGDGLFMGNKETFAVEDIVDRLKEFHSKYFTTDRISITISSKLPFEEQAQIVKLFNIIPRKKPSLILPTASLKINDNFKKKLIMYSSPESNSEMTILISCNSLSKDLIYRPLHYLFAIAQSENTKNSMIHLLKGRIDSFSIAFKNIGDDYVIVLEMDLNAAGASQADKIIEDIHKCLISQIPTKRIFDSIRLLKYDFESIVNKDERTASTYGFDFIAEYPKISFDESVYVYDQHVLRKYLDIFSDINNWTVIVSTPETELENEIKCSQVRYSNPIELNTKVDEATINTLRQNFKKEFVCSANEVYIKSNDPLITSIYHEKFENGEIVVHPFTSDDDLFILRVSFHFNFKPNQIFDNLVFCYAFIIHFENTMPKEGINYFLVDPTFNFEFHGKGGRIVSDFKNIMNELRSFKPTEEEILAGKNSLREVLSKALSLNGFMQTYLSFVFALRNLPFLLDYDFLESIDRAVCADLPEWYVSINSTGPVSTLECRALYEILKSIGKRDLAEISTQVNKKTTIKIIEQGIIEFMMAFKIPNPPGHVQIKLIWKKSVAKLLCVILRTQFISYVRVENPISYMQYVQFFEINKEVFLVFQVKSSLSYEEIERVMLNFREVAKRAISEFDEEEVLNLTVTILKLTFDKYKLSLFSAQTLYDMNETDENFDDFQANVTSSISSITKNDLIELKIFDEDPIIVHSELNE